MGDRELVAVDPGSPFPDQQEALQPLLQGLVGATFRPFLLHGVTGSGKAEVYFG